MRPERMSRLALELAMVIAAAAGCRAPYDPVVIRFQGVDVRRSEFLNELEPLRKNGTDVSDPLVRDSAFGRFLEERVVAIHAAHQGFRDAARNRGEAERWLAAAVAPSKPSASAAQAYYEAHQEIAQVEEAVTLREILVATEQEARDVVRLLATDRNAFELLARTRSKSPQAPSGGLLGSFHRGELPPEIERAAFSLSPGQTSGIVKTPFGYHVLRLESRTAAATRSLAEARPDIDARLAEAEMRLKLKQLIDGLVSQAQVNHEAVKAR